MKSFGPIPGYVFNDATTIILPRWLWHQIKHNIDMQLNKEAKPYF